MFIDAKTLRRKGLPHRVFEWKNAFRERLMQVDFDLCVFAPSRQEND